MPAGGVPDEDDIFDDDDEDEEDGNLLQAAVVAVPDGSEVAVDEINEAGTSMNDFKRGKR